MIKLIDCDVDGTLLDSQKRLPPELPEVIAQLREKGVIFCVASGRQYASLRRDFDHADRDGDARAFGRLSRRLPRGRGAD